MIDYLSDLFAPLVSVFTEPSGGEGIAITTRLFIYTFTDLRQRYRKCKRYLVIERSKVPILFQIRWKREVVFSLNYIKNHSTSKLHMYFGDMKYKRPWFAPWYKY